MNKQQSLERDTAEADICHLDLNELSIFSEQNERFLQRHELRQWYFHDSKIVM